MESEYLSIDTVKRIAELEKKLIEANESIMWWSNRFKSLQETNKIQAKKIIDLTLKKDRAIELLKEAGCYDEETKSFCDDVWEELPKLLSILDGDKNE